MIFAIAHTAKACVSPAPESFIHRLARRFCRLEDAERTAREFQMSQKRGVLKCNAQVIAEDQEATLELDRRAYYRACYSRVLDDKAEAYDKAKTRLEDFDAPIAHAAYQVARAAFERKPTEAEMLCKVIDDARAEWKVREQEAGR